MTAAIWASHPTQFTLSGHHPGGEPIPTRPPSSDGTRGPFTLAHRCRPAGPWAGNAAQLGMAAPRGAPATRQCLTQSPAHAQDPAVWLHHRSRELAADRPSGSTQSRTDGGINKKLPWSYGRKVLVRIRDSCIRDRAAAAITDAGF